MWGPLCPDCLGEGVTVAGHQIVDERGTRETIFDPCETCDGTTRDCRTCEGFAYDDGHLCPDCDGTGTQTHYP